MPLDDYSDMRNCKRCEVCFRTAEDVEECSQCRSREVKASPVFDWNGLRRRTEQVTRASDPAAHYRHVIRTRITDEDIARGYTEVKLDPYRVAEVYAIKGGPREQIMKKCLRFTDKGQSEDQVLSEIESALTRWKQMREEDRLCR